MPDSGRGSVQELLRERRDAHYPYGGSGSDISGVECGLCCDCWPCPDSVALDAALERLAEAEKLCGLILSEADVLWLLAKGHPATDSLRNIQENTHDLLSLLVPSPHPEEQT